MTASLRLRLDELALRQELEVRRARRSFLAFCLYVTPTFRSNWHIVRIARAVDRMIFGDLRRLYIAVQPQIGKLLADDTPVFTPKGWVQHGQLKAGDRVYAPSGRAVRIVAVSEPDVADWLVTTTAGDEIACHGNHQWTVFDRGLRRWVTRSTIDLAKSPIWSGPVGRRGSKARFALPRVTPLVGRKRNLPVHPYVLGAWLGDGTVGHPKVTLSAGDQPVVDKIIRCGFPQGSRWVHRTTGCVTTSFTRGKGSTAELTLALRKAGVLRRKHIPPSYLTASLEQRKELLAGLIDTDGTVWQQNGRCCISTAQTDLSDDIACLLRTMGIRATVAIAAACTSSSGIVGRRDIHQISFNLPFAVPCQLDRKKNARFGAKRSITLRSITKLENPRCGRCIQVDSADGLYLAGRCLTPTHNSTLMSIHFPAFVLGVDPDRRIMAASYGLTLASHFNREVQALISSERYRQVFPGTALRNVGAADNEMALRTQSAFRVMGRRGGLRSLGTQGSATGFSADMAIIDDAIKGAREADSEVTREAVMAFFRGTLLPRLQQGGALTVIGTRWRENDFLSEMLQLAARDDNQHPWEVISLPAIKDGPPTEDDPREDGEALWPARFTLETLAERRRIIGEREFNALYQQRPSPAEGSCVRIGWFKYYDALPTEPDNWVISADLTFSDTGDYTVFTAWAVKGADRYLVDLLRARIGFTDQLKRFVAFCNKWPLAQAKLVEAAANGAALVDTLRRHVPGVIPVVPKGSKEYRLNAVAPAIEAGNVYLPPPKSTRWVDAYLEEFRAFPNGVHDDQVDATSLALLYLQRTQNTFDFAGLSLSRPSPFEYQGWD